MDSDSASHVRSFRDAFQSFIRDHNIEVIAIKKRNSKGDYAGGPITFKMEGIIQLTENCSIELIAPVTISACVKKEPYPMPDFLYKYQKDALYVAYTSIKKFVNA